MPQGFVGMVADGPLFPLTATGVHLGRQFGEMVAAGVQNVRLVFDWSYAQRYRSWQQVPPAAVSRYTSVNGIPTDFSKTDQVVALAAALRLTLLPVVLYAPGWDAAPHPKTSWPTPARVGPYGAFLKALIDRYGPQGSFWTNHAPRMPVRQWQIWNEPNVPVYWARQPFAPGYVALLRAAHRAIKGADAGAKVVLAGLPNDSWDALRSIYRVRGAAQLFDVVAVHPYTKYPKGVITILSYVRQVMDRAGDGHKPMLASEVSWPSALGKTSHTQGFDFATTESGQAANIAALLPTLGADRQRLRLIGFDWETWAGVETVGTSPFNFAGLLRFHAGRFVRKPAYFAFRKAAFGLEHCHRKQLANVCASPG